MLIANLAHSAFMVLLTSTAYLVTVTGMIRDFDRSLAARKD